ncbi:ATP-binding protein [Thiohalophilus thiocyanatoxydans]|uniref:histidine kinase n=1 Tax=Thiohalophilus thiocyanatoxydans TaxID=381308 RepID=A0A4R8IQH9_9GAMM|nr:ATP-binding protein [Thiohalophilus thiocyanatoxydans]TDX99342.1 signal transduction histidine kinase [Thiohalophilus thiocyanatoxydans]
MIFRSLRANLNLGLLLTVAILAIALWGLIGIAVKEIISDYIETRLEHDAETVLVAAHIDGDGQVSLDQQKIQNIYHRPFSGHYFVIHNGEQTLASRSLWDETLSVSDTPEAGDVTLSHQPGPRRQLLLVRQQHYEKQGRQLLIITAEDVSSINAQITRFHWQFGLLVLAVLVILLLSQTAIIHLAMRPVRQAQQAIKKLESGEASELPENVPAEVLPLVKEINRLLRQQQQRLLRSRHAMGDVAHAIKTPLALILQWYESLDEAEQQHHAPVLHQIRKIQQRIDDELKRARLSGDRRSQRRFDLDDDLPPLLDTLKRLYQDKTLQVDVHSTIEPRLPLEQEDGTELLGNLLDNAWKWAASRIHLGFDRQDAMLCITLEDDGPGIEPQHATTLLQRGQRQDESISGHGIGLSIVKQIVESYHGTLQLDRSPALGGLRVAINLPLFGASD